MGDEVGAAGRSYLSGQTTYTVIRAMDSPSFEILQQILVLLVERRPARDVR